MTAPVRSTSVSPFATARPMVHSRRVSLRVGSFGLTYSTERLLWDGAQGAASSSADPTLADPALANSALANPALANPALTDPPPVDPAPAVESERPQSQAEFSTFPLDLEAERKRALWAAAQEQVAREPLIREQGVREPVARESVARTQDGVGGAQIAPAQDSATQNVVAQSGAAQTGQALRRRSTDWIAPNAEMPGATSNAADLSSALKDGANAQTGQTVQGGRKTALTQAMRQATQAYQTCAASFACPRPMLQAVA